VSRSVTCHAKVGNNHGDSGPARAHGAFPSTRSSYVKAAPQTGGSPAPSAVHPGQLLDAGQLAERWQVTTGQVYRLAREGGLPTVRIGRYYRWRLAAIEAWELESEASVGERVG
jgi:excisionase family DNA binding protein